MDLNSVQLGGRLTAKPELRQTKSGHSVCDVSLAVNRMKEGETDFVDVTLWGKTAELASKHLDKGRFINVLGRLQQDKWEDKEGNKRYSMSVTADNLYFGPKTSGSSNGKSNYKKQEVFAEETTTDDVPF